MKATTVILAVSLTEMNMRGYLDTEVETFVDNNEDDFTLAEGDEDDLSIAIYHVYEICNTMYDSWQLSRALEEVENALDEALGV